MVWTKACWIAAASGASLFSAAAAGEATADQPKAIDVQVSGRYDPALTAALAEVGQPVAVTLKGDETVLDLVRARCGAAEPAYLAAFVRENAAQGELAAAELEAPAPGRTFVFPYCVPPRPVTRNDQPIVSKIFKALGQPFDADGLEKALKSPDHELTQRPLATLKLFSPPGQAGSDGGFVAVENALRFLRENPRFDPNKQQATKAFVQDAGERVETVPVRASLTVEAATDRIPPTSATPDDVKVAGLIDAVELREGECANADDPKLWPVDVAALREALTENAALRPKTLDPLRPAQVMLIDTGYDARMGEPAFSTGAFGRLRDFDATSQPIYIGVNTSGTASNDPTPPLGLKSPAHGGQVAATLRGARFLPGDLPAIMLPKVTFASIAAKPGQGAPYLDVGGIDRAFRHALRSEVDLINASVAATTRRQDFLDVIAKVDSILLVTAAGNVDSNNPQFTQDDQSWPGSMGGDPSNAGIAFIISVGAHDPGGAALYFSRRHSTTVDLFAPGCKIPTFSFDFAEQKVVPVLANGTSFAAPIVTFVASLLAAEGLTPRMIKDRLLISAAADERLAYASWSGGRLDVTKALSLYRDRLDYVKEVEPGVKKLRRISGRLRSGSSQVTICDTQWVLQRDLQKLAHSKDGSKPDAPGMWRGWRKAISAKPTSILDKLSPCPDSRALEGPAMVFWNAATNENETIQLNDIVDFVAGFDPIKAPDQ